MIYCLQFGAKVCRKTVRYHQICQGKIKLHKHVVFISKNCHNIIANNFTFAWNMPKVCLRFAQTLAESCCYQRAHPPTDIGDIYSYFAT